jgi:glucosamine 6-phosphate synthetase-like amidotransferase/phosphosugar isomerase protein
MRCCSARERLHIIACGTSYHAGLVAKYWIEEYARLPVSVEVASEYRYREAVVPLGTLFVAISQSGETADTLAACASRAAAAISARWRSATCLSHRWCARRI